MTEKKIAEQAMAYKIEDDKVHYYLNCYDFTVDEDKKQRKETACVSLYDWEVDLTERVMCIYKEKNASFRKAI